MTTGTYNTTHDARRAAPHPRAFSDFAWDAASDEQVTAILARYPDTRRASAIMPLLWLAQEQMKAATGSAWLPVPVIEYVAGQIGMPYMRAYEVATFYTMYNLTPIGKHHVQVCGTTPCLLRGSDDLLRACRDRGLVDHGGTTADGMFTLTEVECLGACANAPMVQIDDDNYEDLTYETMTAILDTLAAGGTPTPGSAIGRRASCPEGGPTTLKEMAHG